MLINEVCRRCGLTKKAVEYYVEQELLTPLVLENGYRDFRTKISLCFAKYPYCEDWKCLCLKYVVF